MESWTESALEQLRAASGRSGGARRAVVDFVARQDCCLTVQEIYDGVREESARVGIASVYRAVEGLVVLDFRGRVVVLFDREWALRTAERFHPELSFAETATGVVVRAA